MAAPTLTYTLTNGTTADASQVMQNFTDLLNGYTDGTKDLSISALTCAGNFTANGTTNTIGNASSDDLVVTASIASDLAVKTDATYGLGSSSKGWTGIYFGANSQRVRVLPPSGLAASYSLTLPTTAGTKGYIPYNSDGSATLTWVPNPTATTAVSADYTVLDNDGYGQVDMTSGASNQTVTLPTAADNSGRVIVVRKVDTGAGTCIVDGEGAETIDGATTYTLYAQWDSLTLRCNGTNWAIVNANHNWLNFTPTTNWTSVSPNGYWRRVAGTMDIEVLAAITWGGGSSGTTTLTITLPASATFGTLPLGSPSHLNTQVGFGTIEDSGSTQYDLHVHYSSTTTVRLKVLNASSTYSQPANVSTSVPMTWASGDTMSCYFRATVTGI